MKSRGARFGFPWISTSAGYRSMPAGRRKARTAAGSTTVNVNLDGRTIAEVTAPHIPGVVEARGV